MKHYGCFLLIIVLLNTGTAYRTNNDDLEGELDTVLRDLSDLRSFNRRIQLKDRDFSKDSFLSAEKKSNSLASQISASATNPQEDDSSTSVEDPIRIAIFNAGEYDSHLIVNYITNNLQQEAQLQSDIKRGGHRSVFMPATATYIRIRIIAQNINNDLIVDDQITSLNGETLFCYLLAHTKHSPVYGICPGSYAAMLADWEL